MASTKLSKEERQEHIEAIREAQSLLYDALEILIGVARDTRNSHAEAYIITPLQIIAMREHGFISHDANLDDWVDELMEDESEDE